MAGHVPITKYGSQIGMRNTITFFRDPVEQVISHYRHAVRDKDYQGDLMSFARLDSTRNIQSRVMANLNPNLVGIVGLTEKYRETLAIVKHRWGWNLQHKRKNVSGRLLLDRFEVSEEEISELEHLNQSDRDLYTRVCQQFRNTWYCLEHETGTDPRGAITDISTDIGLSGWAFDMLSDRPSKIEIFVNGMRHSEVVCNLLVPQIKQWKIPRNGRVGFRTNMESMEIGDRIEVRDVCSGLTLATSVNNGNLN